MNLPIFDFRFTIGDMAEHVDPRTERSTRGLAARRFGNLLFEPSAAQPLSAALRDRNRVRWSSLRFMSREQVKLNGPLPMNRPRTLNYGPHWSLDGLRASRRLAGH